MAVLEVVPRALPAMSDGERRLHLLFRAFLQSYPCVSTRREYAADVASFLSWCVANDVVMLEARRPHIDAYVRDLQDKALANATVNRRISSIRSFYAYGVREEVLVRNPVIHVKSMPRSADYLALGVTPEDVEAMFAAAYQLPDTWQTTRAQVIVSLLFMLGLRISELLAIDLKDLRHERGHRVVHVVRKGGDKQVMLIPEDVCELLDEWIDGRSAGPLIPSIQYPDQALSASQVRRMVKTLAELAGLENAKAMRPHAFRHGCATTALERGAELHHVQDLLGHADPRTTQRYNRARNNLDHSPSTILSFPMRRPS